MWRIAFAQMRAQAPRLIASCVAIIIATGFVVATLVLGETTKATMFKAVGARYVVAAAVVVPGDLTATPETTPSGEDSGGRLGPAVVQAVARVEGVTAVAADTETFAEVVIPGRAGGQYTPVESVAPAEELQWLDLADGRLPTTAGEVTVSIRVGAEVGDTLTVTTFDISGAAAGEGAPPEAAVHEVTVVGVVDLGADPAAGISGRLFATSEQVAAWGGGAPIELRVAAEPGVDLDLLLTDIQAALLDQEFAGTVISGQQAAADRAAQFTRDAADLTTILLVFASLALLVAGMVIANTFSVLLAQRTRELALLRCVGASARQVRRAVLVEAGITGLLASALGVVLGIGLAALTAAVASQADSAIPLEGLSVPLTGILVGLSLGTIVTVLAAVFPVMAATRVAPLAAMRPADHAPIRSKPVLLRLGVALVVFVAAAAALGYGIMTGQVLIAVGGGAVCALGTLLLLQPVIPPVVALAGRTVARFGGLPASLAAGNASRNPRRTAATATALLIGVTLTTAMIVGASSTRATAEAELLASYPTDVIVTSFGDDLPDDLLDRLRTIAGVTTGTALLATEVIGPDGQPWSALGVDFAAGREAARSANGGVPDEGQVSIPTWLADIWGTPAGTTVSLSVDNRSVSLTVGVNDASQSVTMSEADLLILDPGAAIGQIWLKLEDGLGATDSGLTVDDIRDVAGQAVPSVQVDDIATVREALNSILDTMLLVAIALLGIAVVIALIGVGNTLALSVIERRQENGLMRALGLTRGQLRGLLAWEAMLVAGVAAVLGVLLGAGYGLAGTAAILGQVGELVIDIPWLQLLAVVTVATAAGVLASVLPARRAARTSPVAAIAG